MEVKNTMKHKVVKETEGDSKQRKEVGNESPLTMSQKQHTFSMTTRKSTVDGIGNMM
jgi:hypothetical protein